MTDKEPVLLVILVDPTRLRWLVGAIDFDRNGYPLLASEDNDIESYRQMEFEEQVLFLRHRFCGALQRGCDRIWAAQQKAVQFVFVVADNLPDAPAQLTQRIADHLVQWMSNPPVIFYSRSGAPLETAEADLTPMAGEISAAGRIALETGLPHLLASVSDPDQWERVPAKRRNEPQS